MLYPGYVSLCRGGSKEGQGDRSPQWNFCLPLCPPPQKKRVQDKARQLAKFFAKVIKLRMGSIRTKSLLCISCHFNAFMFCDILMIYITEFACVYQFMCL